MTKPGPKTDLTEELTLKIRQGVLDGKLYKNIQEEFDISPNTWDTWVYKDYKDFRRNLISWKKERLLKKSEKISEEILDISHLTEDGKISTDIMRVKQKESEFVRSTLGKEEGYSTKQDVDITTKGEKLTIDDEQFNRIIRARAKKLGDTKSSEGGPN